MRDPAFLFYPGDWLGGTMTFSRSHKGAYMDLLMVQFNNGHMSLQDIETVLGGDFQTMWESKLKAKFLQDESGLFYNQKLEYEINKRKNFTDSRKKNLSNKTPHMESHTDKRMENENENGNKDKNKKGNEKKVHPEFQKCMGVYSDFIKLQTGAPPKISPVDGKSVKDIISYLEKFPNAENGSKTVSELFEYILQNFVKWDKFHKTQIKLPQISSNLINIVNTLKNGQATNTISEQKFGRFSTGDSSEFLGRGKIAPLD